MISTLDADFFTAKIDDALQTRREAQAEKNNDYIEMSASMFELIHGSRFQAKCKCPSHRSDAL